MVWQKAFRLPALAGEVIHKRRNARLRRATHADSHKVKQVPLRELNEWLRQVFEPNLPRKSCKFDDGILDLRRHRIKRWLGQFSNGRQR